MIVSPEIRNLISSDLLEEARKAGVRRISSSSWLHTLRRLFGFFDPEGKEILIDLTKGERLKELYQKKYPELDLKAEEAYLILFLHEVGHSLNGQDESKADEYAKKRFIEWRDATKKKILKAVKEGIEEGFRTRTL